MPKLFNRNCIVCGKPFSNENPNLKCCCIECREIRRKQVNEAYRKTKSITYDFLCEVCEKAFTDTNPQRKYCSKECAKAHEKELYDKGIRPKITYQKTCPICGNLFRGSSGRIYCSSECAHIHRVGGSVIKEVKKNTKKDLHKLAAEATAHGMTYGKYVLWLENQKIKRSVLKK